MDVPHIRTFVVLDLEATGLPANSTDYPVRVMELSLSAVRRSTGSSVRPVPGAEAAAAALTTLPPDQRGLTTPRQKRRMQQRAKECPRTPSRLRRRRQRQTTEPVTPPPVDAATFSALPMQPRLRDSFLVTVNPQKFISEKVTEITGLDNELLEELPGFDAALSEMLRTFLERQPAPVCLVAHNGVRYDFPLLLAELRHCGASWLDTDSVLCADSLLFFREHHREEQQRQRAPWSPDASTVCCRHAVSSVTCVVCCPGMFADFDLCDDDQDYTVTRQGDLRTARCRHPAGRTCVVCQQAPLLDPQPAARRALFTASEAGDSGRPASTRLPSMKLPDIYQRRFGFEPPRQHCAGDDVEALLALCLSYGEQFFSWADRNCQPLTGFTPMWQRRQPEQQRAA